MARPGSVGRSGSYGAHIENQEAYDNTVANRIAANRVKGKWSRWIAADPSREELAGTIRLKGYDRPASFFGKMSEALDKFGDLTAGQEAAIRKILTEDASKKAERLAVAASRSHHVGEVGKRQDFELTLKATTGFQTDFGYMTISILETDDGAVVVYKGRELSRSVTKSKQVPENSAPLNSGIMSTQQWDEITPIVKGERVTLKATVKEHGQREGVAQTIISRPKVL